MGHRFARWVAPPPSVLGMPLIPHSDSFESFGEPPSMHSSGSGSGRSSSTDDLGIDPFL
jgi:hypothetical protein